MNKRLRPSSSLNSELLSLRQLRTLFSKMWHHVMCFAGWIGLRMSVKQSQGLPMTCAQCWTHWLTLRQMYSERRSAQRCWHLANEEYDRKDERHYNRCFLQASTAKGISSCHWINGTLRFLSNTFINLFIFFFSCRNGDLLTTRDNCSFSVFKWNLILPMWHFCHPTEQFIRHIHSGDEGH